MATKAEHNTDLLLRSLRMTEEDYRDLVFNEGMRYLDLYMSDDQTGRAVMMELPDYWSWWQRAFDQRNAQFIASQHLEVWGPKIGRWERALLKSLFNELHSAERLEVKPSRRVMRNTITVLRQRLA